MARMEEALKRAGTLTLGLILLLAVVWPGPVASAANSVGYDVYVTSPDNLGVNMREGPGSSYAKVRENPIPMYTGLHITQEASDSKGRLWGLTSYTENGHVDTGWIFLAETSRSDPRAAASGPADPAAAGLSPAVAKAYAGVLQNIVDQYGVCTAKPGADGFVDPNAAGLAWDEASPDPYLGLTYAELVDFDANGTPELYLYYVYYKYEAENYDNIVNYHLQEEVWHWTGSAAARAYSADIIGHVPGTIYYSDRYLYREGGRAYLVDTELFHHQGIGGRNMLLKQFSNGQMTDHQTIDEFWHIDYAVSDPSDWNEAPIMYSLKINGQSIYDDTPLDEIALLDDSDLAPGSGYGDIDFFEGIPAETKAFYQKYSMQGSNLLYEVTVWAIPKWKSNDFSALLAELRARSIEGVSGADRLGYIAYVGDRSKCRLSAKMADAYANALDSLSGSGWYAVLIDVSADGYPLLLTAQKEWDYDDPFYTVDIWEYLGGEAVRHNFLQDGPNMDGFDFGIDQIKDGQVLSAAYSGGGAVSWYLGGQFYRASHGALTLLHTIVTESSDEKADKLLDGKVSPDPYKEIGPIRNICVLSINGSIGTSLETAATPAPFVAEVLRAYAGDWSEDSDYAGFLEVTEQDDPNVPEDLYTEEGSAEAELDPPSQPASSGFSPIAAAAISGAVIMTTVGAGIFLWKKKSN